MFIIFTENQKRNLIEEVRADALNQVIEFVGQNWLKAHIEALERELNQLKSKSTDVWCERFIDDIIERINKKQLNCNKNKET